MIMNIKQTRTIPSDLDKGLTGKSNFESLLNGKKDPAQRWANMACWHGHIYHVFNSNGTSLLAMTRPCKIKWAGVAIPVSLQECGFSCIYTGNHAQEHQLQKAIGQN